MVENDSDKRGKKSRGEKAERASEQDWGDKRNKSAIEQVKVCERVQKEDRRFLKDFQVKEQTTGSDFGRVTSCW